MDSNSIYHNINQIVSVCDSRHSSLCQKVLNGQLPEAVSAQRIPHQFSNSGLRVDGYFDDFKTNLMTYLCTHPSGRTKS